MNNIFLKSFVTNNMTRSGNTNYHYRDDILHVQTDTSNSAWVCLKYNPDKDEWGLIYKLNNSFYFFKVKNGTIDNMKNDINNFINDRQWLTIQISGDDNTLSQDNRNKSTNIDNIGYENGTWYLQRHIVYQYPNYKVDHYLHYKLVNETDNTANFQYENGHKILLGMWSSHNKYFRKYKVLPNKGIYLIEDTNNTNNLRALATHCDSDGYGRILFIDPVNEKLKGHLVCVTIPELI